MSKIIGLSGRMYSGKNTIANSIENAYINQLFKLGFLHTDEIASLGKNILIDVDGKKCPLIKQYSFAYWLKFICIEILGLTHEQCYGTEEQKNSLTHLRWENMPSVLTELSFPLDNPQWHHKLADIIKDKFIIKESGCMSAREVLQHIGSGIFRRIYENIWVDSTIRQIKKESPIIALLTDVRFRGEVQAIQHEGGLVIRLTRNWDAAASHESETELDQNNFDWKNYNYILENVNMNLEEQELAVEKMMKELGII